MAEQCLLHLIVNVEERSFDGPILEELLSPGQSNMMDGKVGVGHCVGCYRRKDIDHDHVGRGLSKSTKG